MLAVVVLVAARIADAGPPFETDDPEPVEYRHWEFYLATQHLFTSDASSGTAPHAEVNYGVVPGLQLHMISPLAYEKLTRGPTYYGLGDIEIGVKLRFVKEGKRCPMMGTFPQFEVPSGGAAKGLGGGHPRLFVPLWLQKSAGPWTSYGGGGYWVNPGKGNRDYWFMGWQVESRLSKVVTPGAEIFYTTQDTIDDKSSLKFNVGLTLDLTDRHHLLLSVGRSITGESTTQAYFAYQLTT